MLTLKEKLLMTAECLGLAVYDTLPASCLLDGVYIGGKQKPLILMKPCLSDPRYIPVLAEEMGHHAASYGMAVESEDVCRVKSENYGRAWAIDLLLPVCKFAFASVLYSCEEASDYAEAFSLDESFVADAIARHKRGGLWPDRFEPVLQRLVKPGRQSALRKRRTLSRAG